MTMLKTLIPIAFAITAAGATSALALPYDAPTRAVSYADLDMASADGRARLEQRIHAAARAVCGQPSPVDLRSYFETRACRAETFTQSWNQYSARVWVTASREPGAAGTR
jgi:UrcA family protein